MPKELSSKGRPLPGLSGVSPPPAGTNRSPLARFAPAQPAEGPVQVLGAACLVIWAFLLVSRLPELLSQSVGIAVVRPFLILYPLMLVLLLPGGGLLRVLNSLVGIAFVALTAWIMLAVPFSVWKGGSTRWLAMRWLPNMLTFAAFAALLLTMVHWRRVAGAIGWATPVITLSALLAGKVDALGRASVAEGTLGNANELAAILLMALPFWVGSARVPGASMVRKLIVFGSLPLAFYVVLRTGSRSGVLTLGLLCLMFVFQFRAAGRLILLTLMVIVSLVVLAAVPSEIRDRLTTFFTADEDSEQNLMIAESAAGSSKLRKQLLLDSIEAAVKHPLFGVGPGMFAVYTGNKYGDLGEFGGWKEAHNTYTQLASEAGFPALAMFLTALVASFGGVIRVYRAARKLPGQLDVERQAYTFVMSFAGFAVFALFDSLHHLPFLFMMFGLAASFTRLALPTPGRLPAAPPGPQPQPVSAQPAAFEPVRPVRRYRPPGIVRG